MKLPPIIIVGAADHGQVVAEAVEAAAAGKLLGFVDDGLAPGTKLAQGQVLGCTDALPELILKHPGAGLVIAIGDNPARRRCAEKIRALCPGVAFPPVVHPSALVSPSATLDEGAVILAGALVGAGSVVGAFSLINTRASLDHHAMLGDFASLAPAATTGGRVIIGAGTAIGLGAGILQGRTIGTDAVVGAMSLVYHDIPDRTVAFGVPAQPREERKPGKPYLSAPSSRRGISGAAETADRTTGATEPPKVVIIGAGGHGKEIAWNIRQMNAVSPSYEILGYCDDEKTAGEIVLGAPVLGTLEQVAHTYGSNLLYICGVAKNKVRPALVARAEKAGWTPTSVIHPSAVIAEDVQIGPGTYIAAGCYVGPGARLAPHALVNVIASVGHDVTLEEHTQICPGVKLSGGSKIGRGTFIGSNSVVAPGVEVGEWSTLSAATFAAADIPPRTLVTSPVSQHLTKPGKE